MAMKPFNHRSESTTSRICMSAVHHFDQGNLLSRGTRVIPAVSDVENMYYPTGSMTLSVFLTTPPSPTLAAQLDSQMYCCLLFPLEDRPALFC